MIRPLLGALPEAAREQSAVGEASAPGGAERSLSSRCGIEAPRGDRSAHQSRPAMGRLHDLEKWARPLREEHTLLLGSETSHRLCRLITILKGASLS